VDHGVKENMIVEGRSTTSVDLSNLHTEVEYEATIRGFSEDGTVRRVSTPVALVTWTLQELEVTLSLISKQKIKATWQQSEGVTYRCAINSEPSVSCISPHAFVSPSTSDTKITVSAWEGNHVVAAFSDVVHQKCKRARISKLNREYSNDIVEISWSVKGAVDKTVCKLDKGPASPCNSPIAYELNTPSSGAHQIEVIPYCGSTLLKSRKSKLNN
jgi:hypothetical protein